MKPGKSHFRIIALQQRGVSAFSVSFSSLRFFNKWKQNRKKRRFLRSFSVQSVFPFFLKRALDHCRLCSFLGIFQVSGKKRELFMFLVQKSTVSLEPKKKGRIATIIMTTIVEGRKTRCLCFFLSPTLGAFQRPQKRVCCCCSYLHLSRPMIQK